MSNNDVYITKTASFLPRKPVANNEMEPLLGKVGDKPSRARAVILRSNRIKTRYYAIDPKTLEATHSNTQLATEAIKKLAHENFKLNDIQCLAAGTSMPDQLMPNHAVMIHGELGIPPCETVAMAGICVSGMSAMKYAYMSVASGMQNNAVSTGSELASAVMRAQNFSPEIQSKISALENSPELAFEKDFLRWMLSDGAGAVLFQPQANPKHTSLKVEWIEIRSYANEEEACMYAGAEKKNGALIGWHAYTPEQRTLQSIMSVKQDVKLLNNKVIYYTVEKLLAEIVIKKNIKADDIDWFLPHYSSNFFREKVYQGLKNIGFEIPYEKWFSNLESKGNTGSASIYIMLDDLINSGKLSSGEKILCYIPESGRFSSSYMLLTVA
jgi:3-oxoacyl-[acyl-carrier-protein] synthase-3